MQTPVSREKVLQDLNRLRAEIDRTVSHDAEAHHALNQLINDLEAGLAQPVDANDHRDLVSRVPKAIENFETEHPRATAILNDIMVTLSNMGI
jgi:hypothetical protein